MTLFLTEEYYVDRKPKFRVYRREKDAHSRINSSNAEVAYISIFKKGDKLNDYLEQQKNKRGRIIVG